MSKVRYHLRTVLTPEGQWETLQNARIALQPGEITIVETDLALGYLDLAVLLLD